MIPMEDMNTMQLLDDLREILVRSIEAQQHGEHEVAMRLLVEAKDKIDQKKKLLAASAGAGSR
jgi:hypothetical protein